MRLNFLVCFLLSSLKLVRDDFLRGLWEATGRAPASKIMSTPASTNGLGEPMNVRGTMKKILLALCLPLLALSTEASALRRGVQMSNIAACTKVETLPNGNFIYKNSAPLRAGGVGTPLIGYRKEPTLIMNKSYTRGSTTIYDSKGNKIGSCPWASAHGAAGGRFRCTMQTSALRRTAVKNTRSPVVYFSLNKTMCAEVPDAGRCYGSSKGLCGETIK